MRNLLFHPHHSRPATEEKIKAKDLLSLREFILIVKLILIRYTSGAGVASKGDENW